jgi:small-conductance mechanosensitive channel
LLGGLAAIFAVGVALLFRQPVLAEVTVPATPASPGPRANKGKRQAQAKPSSPPPVSTPKSADAAPDKIQQEVDTNLESLKDSLLRMELRRQAGTISDEEYARERGRAEQLLRELVQG